MLSKVTKPKTKAELIRALQAASFRSFEVLEGDKIVNVEATVRSATKFGTREVSLIVLTI